MTAVAWSTCIRHPEGVYFATLYIDEGNLLGFFDDLESARAEVRAHGEEFPETAEDFGFIQIDDDGHRVGEFVSGERLRQRPTITPRVL